MTLYTEIMGVVNEVFMPTSMWLSVYVVFLLFLSVAAICRSATLLQVFKLRTYNTIAAWRSESATYNQAHPSKSTTVTSQTGCDNFAVTSKPASNNLYHPSTINTDHPSLQTSKMTTLDHTLKWNPEPLQKFAALKDFTGENISFLTHLVEWKQSWRFGSSPPSTPLPSQQPEAAAKKRRQQFNNAIRIYAAFISHRFAEFPVNLPSRILAQLDSIFDRPATLLYGYPPERTAGADIAPFAHPDEADRLAMMVSSADLALESVVWYWGPVPRDFDEHVFDEAEWEVRYLVLTNTWPKYLRDGRAWEARCRGVEPRKLWRRFGRHLGWNLRSWR